MPSISLEVWGVILGAIAIVIGVPAFLFSLPQINGFISSKRGQKKIAIFGPPGAGKTSLVHYLRKEAVPKRHNRTIGAQLNGRIALDLTGEKVLYFVAKEVIDVGGEFLQQWTAVIKNYNPDGIFYVVDTTKLELEKNGISHLLECYKQLTEDTLNKDIKIKSISVLINKADIWGGSIISENEKTEFYKNRFSDTFAAFGSLLGISCTLSAISLTHVSYKNAINQCLQDFGRDLDGH